MIKTFWGLAVLILIGGALWIHNSPTELNTSVVVPLTARPEASEAAALLQKNLSTPLAQTNVLFWGQKISDSFALETLSAFLLASRFGVLLGGAPEVWVDEEFHGRFAGRPVFLKGNSEGLKQEVAESIRAGRSLVILTAPVAASTFIEGSPANSLIQISKATSVSVRSLIFADFPRRREQEVNQSIPCILPHADQKGTGPLGCYILQIARREYRNSVDGASAVFLLEALNDRDFLFLTATQ